MTTLIESIIEVLEVDKLDKKSTVEALFYITSLIKKESSPERLTRLKHTEAKLRNRLDVFRNYRQQGV